MSRSLIAVSYAAPFRWWALRLKNTTQRMQNGRIIKYNSTSNQNMFTVKILFTSAHSFAPVQLQSVILILHLVLTNLHCNHTFNYLGLRFTHGCFCPYGFT